MKNWSRHIEWSPHKIEYPSSVDEIQSVVRTSIKEGKKIRIIGSGHSFNPLWTTDNILLSLDQYQGLINIDLDSKQATFKAGTKLHALTDCLFQHGLALENMGDINKQSIAGALGTGTHGTGVKFGNMSTQIRRLKLINGLGEVVDCSPSENAELFKCAQISLGALGVITEVTVQCVDAFILELNIDKAPLKTILDQFSEINKTNRNFEFYWFPNTEYTMTKKSNIVNLPVDKNSISGFIQDIVLENVGYQLFNDIAYYFPSRTIGLARFSVKTISALKKVNYGHRIFVTPRWVRFNEMEYNIPIEHFDDCANEIKRVVNSKFPNILFPLEYRFVKKDDLFLSPAYQRESAYIACHVYYKKDFKVFFQAMETIFLRYDGRPHWGKCHGLKAQVLKSKYPSFGKFLDYREQLDPNRTFLNNYLEGIFYEQ